MTLTRASTPRTRAMSARIQSRRWASRRSSITERWQRSKHRHRHNKQQPVRSTNSIPTTRNRPERSRNKCCALPDQPIHRLNPSTRQAVLLLPCFTFTFCYLTSLPSTLESFSIDFVPFVSLFSASCSIYSFWWTVPRYIHSLWSSYFVPSAHYLVLFIIICTDDYFTNIPSLILTLFFATLNSCKHCAFQSYSDRRKWARMTRPA